MTIQTNEADLEAMLSQLTSDEGRAQVIRNLAGKTPIPRNRVKEAIDTYRRIGKPEEAVVA